jgi:uncharacterized protein with PIN domain
MDGELAELHAKLDRLLQETAAISVALSRADGTIKGVPHYSVIEEHAHQLGRQLSRLVQVQQTKQAVTSQPRQHRCPHCGSICDLEISQRTTTSIDGEMTIPDLVGHCRKCRRNFFPSA